LYTFPLKATINADCEYLCVKKNSTSTMCPNCYCQSFYEIYNSIVPTPFIVSRLTRPSSLNEGSSDDQHKLPTIRNQH